MEEINNNDFPEHFISDSNISAHACTRKINFTLPRSSKTKRDENKNLEKIYLVRKHKSIEDTRIQKSKELEWLVEDKKMLNLNLSLHDLDKFVSGDLEIIDFNSQMVIKQVEEWDQIMPKDNVETTTVNSNKISSSQNLILKNKIIKLHSPVLSLRSLAIECEVTILMSGESNFYIMSRGDEYFSSQMAICFISKELDSARKFVSFAVLDNFFEKEEKLIFKTLKKQEIPKQDDYIKTLDITELKFTFVDNGDDRCFITFDNTETKKSLVIMADFFSPVNENCNLMFGATGELISLKRLVIKQIVRNSNVVTGPEAKKSSQSCNCCKVF